VPQARPLTEKYLFKPQRGRDQCGIGDRVLVSNRRGTIGHRCSLDIIEYELDAFTLLSPRGVFDTTTADRL